MSAETMPPRYRPDDDTLPSCDDRLARAVELPSVEPLNPNWDDGLYEVQSGTDPDTTYVVDMDRAGCECPDATERPDGDRTPCKHEWAVLFRYPDEISRVLHGRLYEGEGEEETETTDDMSRGTTQAYDTVTRDEPEL